MAIALSLRRIQLHKWLSFAVYSSTHVQCAGRVQPGGSKVSLSPYANSICCFKRFLTPCRLARQRYAPFRLALIRLAPCRLAHIRSAFCKLALYTSTSCRFTSVRFAFCRLACVRFAPCKLAWSKRTPCQS